MSKGLNVGASVAESFDTQPKQAATQDERASARKFEEIAVTDIGSSDLNPRKAFDQTAMAELTQSVRIHGVRQPIEVRLTPDAGIKSFGAGYHAAKYEIVMGERRWRAAQAAGLETIPAMISCVDDRTALELALIENICRQDINAIEEAEGYAKLRSMGWEVKQIAERVNRSPEAVSNSVRLLGLPADTLDHVRTGKLSPSHGKALLSWVGYPKLLQMKTDQALCGTPSRNVESLGRDNLWQLETAGIVLRVRSGDVGVDQAKLCVKCEHRRKDDSHDGWMCLKPECAEEKKQAWEHEEAARAAKDAGLAEGTEILDLRKVGYGNWKAASECIFAECKTCTKWQLGREYSCKPKKVCLDTKCFRRLSGSNVRLVNKARRADVDTKMGQAVELLDSGPMREGLENRILVLACLETIRQTKPDIMKLVCDRRGIEDDLSGHSFYAHALTPEKMALLERLAESGDLISIAAEMVIAQAAKTRREFEGHNAGLLDWLVGEETDRTDGTDGTDGTAMPELEMPEPGSVWIWTGQMDQGREEALEIIKPEGGLFVQAKYIYTDIPSRKSEIGISRSCQICGDWIACHERWYGTAEEYLKAKADQAVAKRGEEIRIGQMGPMADSDLFASLGAGSRIQRKEIASGVIVTVVEIEQDRARVQWRNQVNHKVVRDFFTRDVINKNYEPAAGAPTAAEDETDLNLKAEVAP